jgi:cysteinyl-tRNA synthetase
MHQAGKFIGIFSHALMSSKNLASVGEAAVKRMPAEFQREVNSKLEARAAARKARNFKEADRIRDELANMGVELEDLPDGTTKARIRAA